MYEWKQETIRAKWRWSGWGDILRRAGWSCVPDDKKWPALVRRKWVHDASGVEMRYTGESWRCDAPGGSVCETWSPLDSGAGACQVERLERAPDWLSGLVSEALRVGGSAEDACERLFDTYPDVAWGVQQKGSCERSA